MYHRHGGDGHRPSRPVGWNTSQPATAKPQPPYWDPAYESKYSFRQYVTHMQRWVILTDLQPHQQAAMVLQNLGGAAQQLIDALPPSELCGGATVNGVALDPVSNILLKLHHRFAQQDIVTRMNAMAEMLQFKREGGEGINSTLTRFEVIRNKAAAEGQFIMSIEAYAMMLCIKCRLTLHQIENLFLPYGGDPPKEEAQFQTFIQAVRKLGLLHDNSPGTLGGLLQGRNSHAYLTEEASASSSQEWRDDSAVTHSGSQQVFTTWSWGAEDTAAGNGGTTWTFPTSQDDMETDSTSATSSDDGEEDFTTEIPDISGMSEQDAHEHIYYQYRNAKRNWRRFTGRPVRKLRRSFKSSHRSGKGKGFSFGRRTPHKKPYSRGRGFWFTEPVQAFLQSKGKGGKKPTTGKGFGRKGNPRDRNGEIMKCRICQSTEHLMARCPKKGEGKGGSSSSAAPPGFAAYAEAEAQDERTAFLARDPATGTGDGDGRSDPTAGTGDGDSRMGVAPNAPRPPWEGDETFELPTPSGYIVLAGEDPDQEGDRQV